MSIHQNVVVVALGLLTLTACSEPSDRAGPLPGAPEVSGRAAALSGAWARRAVGEGADYQDLALTPAQQEAAHTSLLERRALAWQAVARVLAPTRLREAGALERTVPSFLTWYSRDELRIMFHTLYDELGPEGRAARLPLVDIPGGITRFASHIETLPHWDEAVFRAWLEKLDRPERWNATAGLPTTLLSPAVAQHVLENYQTSIGCAERGAATPDTLPDPTPGDRSVCFASEFPGDAALVKASWARGGPRRSFPVYDTHADALRTRLGQTHGSWRTADRSQSVDDATMFTQVDDAGRIFKLKALHVISKDLPEWLWITLWWSDNPDQDFGEDRPANLGADPVWRNYKMCAVTAYDEAAPVDDTLRTRYPSLAAAHQATVDLVGPSSWCSDPYVEIEPSNHRSNCIGCHQHAGTLATTPAILGDEALFPAQGRAQRRNNFPADYVYGVSQSGRDFEEVVRYFDAHD